MGVGDQIEKGTIAAPRLCSSQPVQFNVDLINNRESLFRLFRDIASSLTGGVLQGQSPL